MSHWDTEQPFHRPSRFAAALAWSLAAHLAAVAMIWQSPAWADRVVAVPETTPATTVVHLRTEALPQAVSFERESSARWVSASSGWVLPDPAPTPSATPDDQDVAEVAEAPELPPDPLIEHELTVDSTEPDPLFEPLPEADLLIETAEVEVAELDMTELDMTELGTHDDQRLLELADAAPEQAQTLNESANADYSLDPDGVPREEIATELEADSAQMLADVMAAYRHELQRVLQGMQTYPRRAQRMNIEGVTYIRFHIDAQQGITGSMVVASSGHAILDSAAQAILHAVSEWPEFPAELLAQHIHELSFEVPIEYRLN